MGLTAEWKPDTPREMKRHWHDRRKGSQQQSSWHIQGGADKLYAEKQEDRKSGAEVFE